MKFLVILCVFVFVGLSLAETVLYPRGCVYALGRCIRECEEGTHAYAVGCGILTPEATCSNPNPVPDKNGGLICDYSSCYCDPPTVRDTATNKCVKLEDCSKPSSDSEE